MRRVVWLNDARRDLAQIQDYVTRTTGSVAMGTRVTADLRRRVVELASLPATLGRDRRELVPDVRSAVHKNYIIFFRYRDNFFEVVDVIEGHRDLDAFFAADD